MHELGLSNGRNRPDRPKDRARDLSINANKRDGVGSPLGFAAPKSERSNIDSELPQSASDLADDAGLVAVSQVKNGPLKLRLQRNTFDLKHPRRTIMEDRAFSRKAWR